MHRRIAAGVAAGCLSLVAAAGYAPHAAAVAAPPANPAAPAPPQAKAWLVADADTGAVIASFNDHAVMRPASIAKILTGLLAIDMLPPDATVAVGADAQGTEAAKINMKAGQVWTLTDTLHSLLMVSANDAAVALADKLGGSEAGFAALAGRATADLGAVDHPIFNDPAGLDDSFAYGGGNEVSAYDMAVITRAAMSLPDFRAIVANPLYHFIGPDGVHHTLHNHNKLLLWDPTVIGVKPGYTRAAGDTFVAEATRGGRSMLVVELDSAPPAMYSGAEALLAQGFATPVSAETGPEQLPPVKVPTQAELTAPTLAPAAAAPQPHRSGLTNEVAAVHGAPLLSPGEAAGALGAGGILLLLGARRRRTIARRRDARRPAGRRPTGVVSRQPADAGSPSDGSGGGFDPVAHQLYLPDLPASLFDQDQLEPRNPSTASMHR
ncbi:MAG TPA: hypothetical protein VFA11_01405 [Acidimicrobiales bacterium]|nr:hypothetical protein [Acidimicrobiales bacterium]